MKLTLSLLVLTLNLLSVNFFVANAQNTRGLPRSGGSPLGPNLHATGGSGGAITGAYSFSGGFLTVNDTNVFLQPGISNLVLNPAITNLNDSQFGTETTIATIKSGVVLTNHISYGTTSFRRVDDSPIATITVDGNNAGVISINYGIFSFLISDNITNDNTFTNLGDVYVGGGMSVGQGLTNTAGAVSSAIYKIPGTATNMFLMLGGNGNIVTGRIDAATMAMSADGILSSTVVGGSGTNFSQIRLDGEIYNITNAGNNTTVTADWNGPHWLRLQLAGSTTISFTNCPAASSTNGQVYVLELYAPTTVPSVTIQNIDPRAIDWGKVGQPVLVDGETNLLVVRFDGTNFLGRSWQDKTVGTITSPYVLEKNSTTSNHTHYGVTSLTNLPGDGSPELRIKGTNGNSYIGLSMIDNLIVTQKFVFNVTNPVQNEVLKIQAVAHSGGLTTITLTNGVDTGGSGSPGGDIGNLQFRDTNSTFAGTTNLTWDQSQSVLYGKTTGAGEVRIQLSGISAPNETNEMGSSWLRMKSAHDLGIGNNNSNNWLFTSSGDFTPFTPDAHNIGELSKGIKSLFFTRTIQPKQHFIESDRTLTNFDLSLGQLWAQNTNLAVDMMIAVTNPVPGEFTWHFIGRTNAAINHVLIVTNAPGVTLNWMGSSTNGPNTLTVYSNSFLKVFGSVSTNLLFTNVYLSWISDSAWPQRNQAIIASAGGSTSNLTVGGLVYYDGQKYTNHSNAQNVTNYAYMMLPANILTNDGDAVVAEWDIMHQSGSDGTNQFFIGFGANTNIFNTGSITNNRNMAAKLRAEITRTGNSSQHIFCEYKVHNGFGNFWYGIATNAEISETCGITNILRMHGRKAGVNTPGNVGNHTNNQFKVWYQPISR